MHFMKFELQFIDFRLTVSFSLEHFIPQTFILFSQNYDSLFEMSFLLHVFAGKIPNLSGPCLEVLLQSIVLSFQAIKIGHVISFKSFNFLDVVYFQLGLESI